MVDGHYKVSSFWCFSVSPFTSPLLTVLIPCVGHTPRRAWNGVRLWEFGEVFVIIEFSASRSLLTAVCPRPQERRGTQEIETLAELHDRRRS